MEQNDPLLPNYKFNAHLVAGMTPINRGTELDFLIDRPNGMKGYILNLTIKGKGQIFSDENQFTVNEGDLLLFPPQTQHYYQRHPDSECWYHRWIYFRHRGYWSEILHWNQLRNSVYHTPFSPDKTVLNELSSLFMRVEAEYKSKKPYSKAMAAALLEQLLIKCKQLQPEQQEKQLDPRIHQVITFLMTDIKQDISIEELANLVYLSPSRLTHLFTQELGMSILQWRDDQRIIYAKQLLLTSQSSINTIARNVGFKDPLYFSRVFKKYVGVSPKKFRE